MAVTVAQLAEETTVERLALEPGDVVVVRVARKLSNEQAERLKERVERSIPDHVVIVLAPEVELEAAKP